MWFAVIKLYRFDDYKYNYKIYDVILAENPEYKFEKYSRSPNHRFELSFVDESLKYEISADEFKFLKINDFTKEIKKGDCVKIVEYDQRIFSLVKNKIDYLNYKEAENYKKLGENAMTIIMTISLSLCLIPIFINRNVNLAIKIKGIEVKYEYIFYLFITIVIIYLYRIKK